MIQYLFKANVLCTLLLAVFVAVGTSNLAAQNNFSTAKSTSNDTQAEVKPESHDLSNDDLMDFREDLSGLIEDTKQNSSLPEYERSVREHYYKEFGEYVFRHGFSIEYAANAAIQPTEQYTTKLTDGHKVDLQQLKEDTINYFK